VVPTSWIECRREEDGELVGFLVPSPLPDDTALVTPVTLFGYPLAGPLAVRDAERILTDVGLSYLADRWQLRLDDGRWIRVEIVEVSPDEVVVQKATRGNIDAVSHRFSLPVPVGDVLAPA
jgi:hypothetical protein